jgi:NADPH:quinone reductase-like Zn-dependent oxidoreductase
MVRSIGADRVIDYTREDFTQDERSYDVILDLIGNHTIAACRRVLHPDGVYVAATGMPGGKTLGPLPYVLRVALSSLRRGPKTKVLVAKSKAEDLAALTRLIEAGEVTPVIDRTFGLPETAEALARQGEGHARGKTVVIV